MRLELSPEISAFIAARIANYAIEVTELYHRHEAPEVAKFAALPLVRHWEETIGLRADGEFVRWSTDDYGSAYSGVRSVDERYNWLSALVEGSRRWPQLDALIPVRPSGAVACRCAGHPSFAPGKFICPECGGLGWVDSANISSSTN